MNKPETMNAQASAAEAERLREAIRDMNDLANRGFNAVAAIARLAHHGLSGAMASPLGHGDLQATLLTLASVADDYGNAIDATAETEIRQDSAT